MHRSKLKYLATFWFRNIGFARKIARYGTHEILGQANIPASEFTTPAGFEGEVQLFKPGKTSIWSTKSGEATPAGVLLLQITWGAPLGFRSVTNKDTNE